jgi:hypothetical protein
VREVQSAAASPRWEIDSAARYRRLLGYLAAEPADCLDDVADVAVLRTVEGRVISPKDVERSLGRDGWIYVATAPSSLTAHLSAEGTPVILSLAGQGETDPAVALVTGYLCRRRSSGVMGYIHRRWLETDHFAEVSAKVVTPDQVLVEVVLDARADPAVMALLDDAHALLKDVDAGYRELRPGVVRGSLGEPRLFVLGRSFGPVMALPPGGVYTRTFLDRPRALVNLTHPHVRRLLSLRATQPDLAAYCLAKALLLAEDRRLDLDFRLIELASRGTREAVR